MSYPYAAIAEQIGREQRARSSGSDPSVASVAYVAPWPTLDDSALYGLAGDFVRMVEPHTEADPAAMLVQYLQAAGCSIGSGPYYEVEADRHRVNLFAVVVGDTASGRKGTSWGHVRRVVTEADPHLRIRGGLSSGEGLVYEVRDPVTKSETDKDTGRTVDTIVDPGEKDKRLLTVESEFASVLKVATRQGNTVATTLRDAWDSRTLAPMTKTDRLCATDPHISIVGHVTQTELLKHLTETDAASGFANRFLWVCSRRSKLLPRGGSLSAADLRNHIERLRAALEVARRIGRVERTEETWQDWERVYEPLTTGRGGLMGAMVARGAAHVTRLSTLYALLDGSSLILPEHQAAALAVWQYCEDSAGCIFGQRMGDPVADKILDALREAGGDGLTRTDIRDLGQRHWSAEQVDSALASLRAAGLAYDTKEEPEGGVGRHVEKWRAATRDQSDQSDIRGEG